jgi:hypothetical protein
VGKDADLNHNITLEVEDVKDGHVLWSRNFPKEAPVISFRQQRDSLVFLGFRGVRFSDTPIPFPASCCGVLGFVQVISDSRRIAFEPTHSGPVRAGGDAGAIVLFDPGGVDVQFRTRS